MKLRELVKKLESFGQYSSSLCTYFPQLIIENVAYGNGKMFSAIYDDESGCLELNGTLWNPIEINALSDFLGSIGHISKNTDEENIELTERKCQCGSDDWNYIGKGDLSLGPEAGDIYHILQCNSCERYFRLTSAIK
jgi:hypothetical protein